MVLVSLTLDCATLLLASFLGVQYGVGTTDGVSVLLTPFQTLNAESLPAWFDKKSKISKLKKSRGHSFLTQGFSGNFMLLLWAVMGSFITMAFLSNIRSMLLMPVYEKPIDTTKDIFDVGRIPVIPSTGHWINYFKTSGNVWERQVGADGIFISIGNREMKEKYLKEDVHTYGTHVMLDSAFTLAHKVQNDEYFKKQPTPVFRIAREGVR